MDGTEAISILFDLIARANFSELAEEVKASAEKIVTKNGESFIARIDSDRLDYYHQLERERIHLLLIGELSKSRINFVDEGFQQHGGVAIMLRPVLDHPVRGHGEDMGAQIGNLHGRQK